MSLLSAKLEVDGRLRRFTPRVFEGAFNRALDRWGAEIAVSVRPTLVNLTRYPGAVRRPIEWASPKQRRAFFATNGFGRGIPTQRSGREPGGWRIAYIGRIQGQSGGYQLSSATPYSPFLRGTFASIRPQQPFHRNTGYRTAIDIRKQLWEAVALEQRRGLRRAASLIAETTLREGT